MQEPVDPGDFFRGLGDAAAVEEVVFLGEDQSGAGCASEEEVGLLKAVRESAGWNLFRITTHFILDYGQEGIDPAGGGRHANAWLEGPEIGGEAPPSGVACGGHAGGIDLWAG